MANGLSTFINMLGQKPQPGFAAGMMKGQDEALARRKLEEEMERDEALAPWELLKAQREAIQGPQENLTAMQRNYNFILEKTGNEDLAFGLATGSLRLKEFSDGYKWVGPDGTVISPGAQRQVDEASAAMGGPTSDAGTTSTGATPGPQPTIADPTAEQTQDTEQTSTVGLSPLQLRQEELRRQADKADADEITKGAANYGDDLLGTKGLLESERVIGSLSSRLHGFAGEEEDVPSRGYLERLTPGIMRDLANDAGFKDWFISEEGLTVRNEAALAGKMFVSSISGADVTDEEQARYDRMLGQLASSSRGEFLQGLRTLQELVKVRKRHIGAKYTKEARDRYWEQFEGTEDEGLTEYGAIGGQESTPKKDGGERFSVDKVSKEDTYKNPETGEVIYKHNGQWVDAQGKPYKPQSNADSGQGGRGQRGGAATNQATGATQDTPTPEQQDTVNEVAQSTPSVAQPTPEQNPVQQAVGILQKELDRGVSKRAVLEHLNEMKADRTITMQQYRQIVRELQLGTFDTFKSSRRDR